MEVESDMKEGPLGGRNSSEKEEAGYHKALEVS